MFRGFNKRGVSEIIGTILIVLIVLAVAIILWQVISRTVGSGSEQIDVQSSCIGITMEITRADEGSSEVVVRRGQGTAGTKVSGYKLFLNGEKVADVTAAMEPLDTNTYTLSGPLVSGNKVSAAALVGEAVCAASSEFLVE